MSIHAADTSTHRHYTTHIYVVHILIQHAPMGWGMAQVVQHLLSKQQTLTSNPTTAKKSHKFIKHPPPSTKVLNFMEFMF
jgi:hypothetical protein